MEFFIAMCSQFPVNFPSVKNRKIQTEFSGGDITSDGGVMLLRSADEKLNLLRDVNKELPDARDPKLIKYSQLSLLRQRIFGICLGYDDLNDHKTLRNDPALQSAVNRVDPLASQSTLCRLENRTDRQAALKIHEIIIKKFITSFNQPPDKLILDFDATDDRVHGHQEGRAFHGYYDHHCFLPLYVFCGEKLLVSYLRPGNSDGFQHAWAILSLLVKRLRKQWSKVKIIVRGNSGFCRKEMLSWCEKNDVDYIVGIPQNKRLNKMIQSDVNEAKEEYEKTQQKIRKFKNLQYAAGSWNCERRIIVKIKHLEKGSNPRFIVTNLEGTASDLYDDVYCARGEMENRIKEQQLDLFADRTSCHSWWANQFRLLLSSLAYILLEQIRVNLVGTELAWAQAGTIRLKLLKIGAVILRNSRRIRFLLSSA